MNAGLLNHLNESVARSNPSETLDYQCAVERSHTLLRYIPQKSKTLYIYIIYIYSICHTTVYLSDSHFEIR